MIPQLHSKINLLHLLLLSTQTIKINGATCINAIYLATALYLCQTHHGNVRIIRAHASLRRHTFLFKLNPLQGHYQLHNNNIQCHSNGDVNPEWWGRSLEFFVLGVLNWLWNTFGTETNLRLLPRLSWIWRGREGGEGGEKGRKREREKTEWNKELREQLSLNTYSFQFSSPSLAQISSSLLQTWHLAATAHPQTSSAYIYKIHVV